jgi:hypothetical protein
MISITGVVVVLAFFIGLLLGSYSKDGEEE